MTAARWLALAAAVALPLSAAAQEDIPLEAPRPVRAHLDRLHHADPAVRADAAAALAADDRNAPFLRFERAAAVTESHRAALDAALAPSEARAAERHAGRAKGWVKERRLDLLAGYLTTCPADEVPALVDPLLRTQQAIHAVLWPGKGTPGYPAGFIPAGSVDDLRCQSPTWQFGRAFAPRSGASDAADGWTFDGRRFPLVTGEDAYGFGALLVARGGLKLTRPGSAWGWSNNVVLATGRVELSYAKASLVVTDGDVVFLDGASCRRTVVVAAGSVSAPGARAVNLEHARVYAGGSIDLPNLTDQGENLFQAGGAADVAARQRDGTRVVARAPAVPFGIRFVSPEDFGFRTEPGDGGVAVAAVEAWSPLARFGVRAGDVVVRVGFENTRTPDDLRRSLGRGVIEESAVLHLRRGGARLTRVVYLDGIPERR